MSSSDPAISVRGLSKQYVIRHNANEHITLAELALDRLRHPFHRAERETLWALRDLNFDVMQGEVLGLIGLNGAGKTTLLKVLSGITNPTAGEIHLWGRVGSLLEVGTGFHPELTGRENVYLNGAILGMARKEIERKFDDIVEFAGVERFLDTPVKRYSSGMYVRLAFAIAAHLDSEILLLDELLAVGDGDFQAKCFSKVSDLASEGRTVILVSHNNATVRQFTTRAVLLERGALVVCGPTETVLGDYVLAGKGLLDKADVSEHPRYDPTFGRRARLMSVRLNHDHGMLGADDDLSFTVTVRATEDLDGLQIGQTVHTLDGGSIGASTSSMLPPLPRGTDTEVDVTLPRPGLAPGRYFLAMTVGFGDNASGIVDLDRVYDSVYFEVAPPLAADGRVSNWQGYWGAIRFETSQVTQARSRAIS
jgi:lipopolysaccharide transport system ATP-binding protein